MPQSGAADNLASLASRQNPVYQRTGLLLLVLATVLYGTIAISAKLAFAAGSTAGQALTWRSILATLLLWSVLRLARTSFSVTRQQLGRLVVLGALGQFGQSLTFMLALQFIPAALAAVLLSLAPVVVGVLAWLVWREPLTGAKLGALLLSLLGVSLVIGTPTSELDPRGVLLGIFGALMYAGYFLYANRMIGRMPRQVAVPYITASATFSCVIYTTFFDNGIWPTVTSGGWAAYLAMATALAIATVAFFAGLERIGPTRAAIVASLEPVVTVVAAAVVLGESLSLLQILGGGFVIGAVLILHRSSPAPMALLEP